MKKFSKPFDAYEIGRFKPIAIELDRTNFIRYRDLADNPLYYLNSIQYTNGEFYRAVLGYETLWDSKKEAELMLCLDYYLNSLIDNETYYFLELEPRYAANYHGVKWFNQIPPKTFRFDLQWLFTVKPGQKITARVNLIDKPNHIDLELPNGDVYTLQYMKFLHYMTKPAFKILKDQRYEKPTKPTRSKPNHPRNEEATTRSCRLTKPNETTYRTQRLLNRLLYLQEAYKRKASLR